MTELSLRMPIDQKVILFIGQLELIKDKVLSKRIIDNVNSCCWADSKYYLICKKCDKWIEPFLRYEKLWDVEREWKHLPLYLTCDEYLISNIIK